MRVPIYDSPCTCVCLQEGGRLGFFDSLISPPIEIQTEFENKEEKYFLLSLLSYEKPKGPLFANWSHQLERKQATTLFLDIRRKK